MNKNKMYFLHIRVYFVVHIDKRLMLLAKNENRDFIFIPVEDLNESVDSVSIAMPIEVQSVDELVDLGLNFENTENEDDALLRPKLVVRARSPW